MSEVTTDTTPALTKSALTKLFAPFAKPLADALDVLVKAEAKVLEVTLTASAAIVAVGHQANLAEASMVANGATREQVKETLVTAVGKGREWSTIRGWMVAAETAEALPAEIRDAFTAQTLIELSRAGDEKQVKALATKMHKAGKVTVAEIRPAVKALRVKAGTSKVKSPTKIGEALTRKYKDGAASIDRDSAVSLVGFGFVMGLALRDNDQNREAGRQAIAVLFGPKPTVDVDAAEAAAGIDAK